MRHRVHYRSFYPDLTAIQSYIESYILRIRNHIIFFVSNDRKALFYIPRFYT